MFLTSPPVHPPQHSPQPPRTRIPQWANPNIFLYSFLVRMILRQESGSTKTRRLAIDVHGFPLLTAGSIHFVAYGEVFMCLGDAFPPRPSLTVYGTVCKSIKILDAAPVLNGHGFGDAGAVHVGPACLAEDCGLEFDVSGGNLGSGRSLSRFTYSHS